MRYKNILPSLVLALILVMPACADSITEWNSTAIASIQTAKLTSVPAARVLAMVHAAMYDAGNSATRFGQPYRTYIPTKNASPDAAAAMAAYTVLCGLFPAQTSALTTTLQNSLANMPDSDVKTRGIALGTAVGEAMLAWRATDGAQAMVMYVPGTQPGEWRPTPPNFADAMMPHWAKVYPFVMRTGSSFRPQAPYAVTNRAAAVRSRAYARDLNEVMALGGKMSMVRTPEQTAIATFWADSPGTITTVGRWNLIAQQIATRRGSSVAKNARLFAVLNLALADAGIAAWDCKYYYNFWRPITAIQQADIDDNRATTADPSWEPLLMTPAFPEYVSAHSTFSGAAAMVLGNFFGDRQRFTVNPYPAMMGMPAPARSYSAFSTAAFEAGRSRIYGGIHFECANQQGLRLGARLGDYTYRNVCRTYR